MLTTTRGLFSAAIVSLSTVVALSARNQNSSLPLSPIQETPPTPSIALNLHIPSPNTTTLDLHIYTPACFNRTKIAGQAQYAPILMDDYYSAIQKILITPDATIPHHYYLANDPSFTIRWYSNHCGIYLGALQRAEYFVAPVAVAHVAAVIADECLTKETGFLGGVVGVGVPEGSIMVLVSARAGGVGGLLDEEVERMMDLAEQ